MNAVKKNHRISTRFLTKIRREIPRISYKNSPHLLSNISQSDLSSLEISKKYWQFAQLNTQ